MTNTEHGPEPDPVGGPFPPPGPAAPEGAVPEPAVPEASAAGPSPAGPAAPGGWSALVYGRTLQVDQWWRALPAGVDRQGAVADAVRAAVAGGNRLEAGPRFLLHRDARGVLVGAACELGLISRTMVHDRFGRPLYGFVGWYRAAEPGAAVGRIPELAELAKHLADWAGPVYTEWITPTWEAVGREEAEPTTTRPVAAPWRGLPASAPAAAVWLPAHSAGTHLLPESDAAGLWAAAAVSRDRCLLATGWRRRSDADAHRFTHLTSADCRGYELLRPPPPPPPPPPRPVPAPGPGPAGGPAGHDGGSGGSADPESLIGEAYRAGRRALRRVARGLLPAEPDSAGPAGAAGAAGRARTPEPPGSPASSEPPARSGPPGGKSSGARDRRYGDDPVTGRRYYGDLDGPSAGPPQPPARPAPPGGVHPPSARPTSTGPESTGPGSADRGPFDPGPFDRDTTDRGPGGRAAPGHRAQPPSYRQARAVDPQQADLSGMFGEFDEPETPPPAPPSEPRQTRSEAPDPRPTDDSATGEPS
ncbi:hypothetical protein ACIPYS_31710 [Kitasatospora sp. NPDC089913]|uniref:hypothetical protein n=1 Tax=Kitasatospora sp. NPDC089913 TaxID=3364080 RepID=UPI00381C9CEC